MISSPYDREARYSSKRSVEWVGYKVHLTETCDPDTPHLITNVETTPAASPDDNMLAVVHASLAIMDRLPAEHLVDRAIPIPTCWSTASGSMASRLSGR
jgi:transposase